MKNNRDRNKCVLDMVDGAKKAAELAEVRADMGLLRYTVELLLIHACRYSHDDKTRLFKSLARLMGKRSKSDLQVIIEGCREEERMT